MISIEKSREQNYSCRIPRKAGVGPSAMRAMPDEVYASLVAPAMRAENFN